MKRIQFSESSRISDEGTYKCKISNVDYAISKNDNEVLVVIFKDTKSGKTLDQRWIVDPKVGSMIHKYLTLILGKEPDMEFDPQELLGKKCKISVVFNQQGYLHIDQIKASVKPIRQTANKDFEIDD